MAKLQPIDEQVGCNVHGRLLEIERLLSARKHADAKRELASLLVFFTGTAVDNPSMKLTPAPTEYIIVELSDEETDETRIEVEAGTNYAVARIGTDGVARLIDYSYRSPMEAAAAWVELGPKTIQALGVIRGKN